jgi:hypothetical protein
LEPGTLQTRARDAEADRYFGFMDRTFLTTVLSISAGWIMAQYSGGGLVNVDVGEVTKSTTYLIPTTSPEFDRALRRAMEENWTFSRVGEEIQEEIDLKDESKSYIGIVTAGNWCALGVVRGGINNKPDKLGPLDVVAYAPISSTGDEPTIDQCIYRLPLMVHAIEQALKARLADPKKKVYKDDDINEGTDRLRGKTILVERALLNEEEIKVLDEGPLPAYGIRGSRAHRESRCRPNAGRGPAHTDL